MARKTIALHCPSMSFGLTIDIFINYETIISIGGNNMKIGIKPTKTFNKVRVNIMGNEQNKTTDGRKAVSFMIYETTLDEVVSAITEALKAKENKA